MDEIINLILIECKKIFNELATTTKDTNYIEKYGIYPTSAIIKFHDKFSRKLAIGNTLRVWSMTEDSIDELNNLSIQSHTEPISGMYFKEAIFLFAINTENKMVNLSFHLGPRYGLGLLYDIENTEIKQSLSNKRTIWCS